VLIPGEIKVKGVVNEKHTAAAEASERESGAIENGITACDML
jgi:hypothetical protein